ncbi:hypothetical protein HYALB_00002681 [Hymenoscyphus albidus]|uniref:Carboxylic ester hydrolase n=1 Tax=Hymenoscyphus albidus TaxID=595503 RepID=A0A9N9M212_9HELO|nr:hypothetical protein HYALB_00002681 [Hymenoscyphus albidus]
MNSLLCFHISFLLFRVSYGNTTPQRSVQNCSWIPPSHIEERKILSVTSQEYHNHSVPGIPAGTAQIIVNICEVNVTFTHPGVNDTVVVQVWHPLSGYNGRFVAAGGGGFAPGGGDIALAPHVARGYAAASTDGGLGYNMLSGRSRPSKTMGSINVEKLRNVATRSPRDVATVGKAVTESYYGKKLDYSYWYGCSTGGRQGMEAAQRYPELYDGILAGAPAIFWDKLIPSLFWPQVVMKEEGIFPSPCELNAVTKAGITSCDRIDGVEDGVITDLSKCTFDAFKAVGMKAQCDGKEVTITPSTASIEGPTTNDGKILWDGLTIPTSLESLSNSSLADGKRIGNPFAIVASWIQDFIKEDVNFDLASIDRTAFAAIFAESVAKYSHIISSSKTHLSALQKSGTKLLHWHGEADQLIPSTDASRYREKVEKVMGGNAKVNEFYRLFLAPGVDHCGYGSTPGAVPIDPLGVLRSWVENGTAPEIVLARTPDWLPVQFTRKLCIYPLVAKYRGFGDSTFAESFECVRQ